jgi:hypothetical protein
MPRQQIMSHAEAKSSSGRREHDRDVDHERDRDRDRVPDRDRSPDRHGGDRSRYGTCTLVSPRHEIPLEQ